MNKKLYLTLLPAWLGSLAVAYWVGSSASPSPDLQHAPTLAGQGKGSPFASHQRAGSSVSSALVEEDDITPLDTIRQLIDRPESAGTWAGLDEAVAKLRPLEAREALAWVMRLPPGQKRDAMVLELMDRWASLDPSGAVAFVNNIESARLRDRATSTILRSWGRTDPAAAMSWLNQNTEGLPSRALNQRALSVIEGYAQTDPTGAFYYSSALPDATASQRDFKARALRDVMREMVGQERVNEALGLLAAMPDTSARASAFGELIQEWAQYDPQGASHHIQMLGEEASGEAKRALVRSWAQNDPESAARWLSTLPPDDPEMGNLVTSLVGNWTRYDLEASAAWLNQMPPSPDIDRAVAIYTFRSAQEDPAGAMSWAESITRDDMRNRLMTRVAAEWRQQDPQSFQTYLDSSDLPEEQKTRLQNAQGGGGWTGGWGGRGGRERQ